MICFLPYSDFAKCASVLDKKRCWKQVVETKQIINCLENTGSVKWGNHPAVKMWVGSLNLLKGYYNIFLHYCIEVHKINTTMRYFTTEEVHLGNSPFWLGNEDFHRSHRARLISKNRDFYLPKFPDDENYNSGLYWWPDMTTKTFKTIVPKERIKK